MCIRDSPAVPRWYAADGSIDTLDANELDSSLSSSPRRADTRTLSSPVDFILFVVGHREEQEGLSGPCRRRGHREEEEDEEDYLVRV